MVLRFYWDAKKARENYRKHGVRLSEAIGVFSDPLALCEADIRHSLEEVRYVALGHAMRWRLLVVTFTERDNRLRLISARPASPRERKAYEEASR